MRTIPAVGATLGGWLAFTPSLLPREAVLQGLLGAVAALLGYGLFALIAWVLGAVGLRVKRPQQRLFAVLFGVLGVAGTVIMLWLSFGWQQEQRELIGMPPARSVDPLIAVLIALVTFALMVLISRFVRTCAAWAGRIIAKVLPARVAAVIGLVLVLWASFAFVNDVAVGRVAERLDSSFLLVNDEFKTDTAAPKLSEVSAGPGSAVSWNDLGRQGRIFINNTPTQDEIVSYFASQQISKAQLSSSADAGAAGSAGSAGSTGISGSTDYAVMQPIRVYVGAGASDLSLVEQVDIAVGELKRTGAFERDVINVATGTGRGWVNENQARALEYLWLGNTATVSVQYSYLPSWMSYLVDNQRARAAGAALFDGVYRYWSTLPEASRPKLVVSGESLGSFGSEGAFSGASDLAARTDGALWVGPTANNVLWQHFTKNREPGTPIYLPEYQGGSVVRFSADGTSWLGEGDWQSPRVGYLQHANDPVTWLDFGATFSRPDFLNENRGQGVPPQMIWVPVITTLQLVVDQLASGIPDGQGHEFGQAPVYAWAEILPPAGWHPADSASLAEWLAKLRLTDLDTSSSS